MGLRTDDGVESVASSHLPFHPRVVHLGKYYPPALGGIETHVQTLARAQAALGADVTVACLNHERDGSDVTWSALAPTVTQEERDGPVRVVRLGRQACIAKLDISVGLVGFLARLGREPPDIVHLHVPNPTMLLALCAVRVPAPLVITYHSDVVRQRLRRLALRIVEDGVYGRAGRILCTSPLYAPGSPALARHVARVRVVPFGVRLEPFLSPGPDACAERDRLVSEHGSPLWLAVGRLVYYKGLQNAIAALPHVPGKLLVIGTGPLRASLERQARSRGVADRVVWLGQVGPSVLAGAYLAATALIFPSNARSEAFGLVQVEAMASGCPVLNAAIPASGVPWVSRHGESGLTVPVDDVMALAQAARALVDEPLLRQRLSAGARRRAVAQFDHNVMARRSLEIYRELTEETVRPIAQGA